MSTVLDDRMHGDTIIQLVWDPDDEECPLAIHVQEQDGGVKVLVAKDGPKALEIFRLTHRYVDWPTARRVFS